MSARQNLVDAGPFLIDTTMPAPLPALSSGKFCRHDPSFSEARGVAEGWPPEVIEIARQQHAASNDSAPIALGLLTESDLDAHEADRLPLPSPIEPIKTVEQEHPGLWKLYAAGAIAAIVASAFFPAPWFGS